MDVYKMKLMLQMCFYLLVECTHMYNVNLCVHMQNGFQLEKSNAK